MANELSALAEVAAETIDALAITPAQSLHRAIARRAFGPTSPASAPARAVHDSVATALYDGTRRATVAAGALAATALRRATPDEDVRPLSRTPRGRFAISVINGLIGDRLEERESDLAIPMSVRHRGEDVPCQPDAVRRAFRRPTRRIALFLHGLFETEESWRRGAARHPAPGDRSFGDRLRRNLGLTPVELRYNTGLHVSENGRRLAVLLEALVDAWPLPVDDVAIVGHSMGGLVARSACALATDAGTEWPQRVRHLVTLGAPHTGAPLEKAVHAAAWAMRAVPEASAFGGILEQRSAGIRDLRFGALRDEDWLDEEPGGLLVDRCTALPLLEGCTHTFITATLTRDSSHPLAWIAGDLLVRTDSAAGRHRTRAIPVDADRVVHIGGLHHFDLLDHPLVYEEIRRALT
jgi:pimeloyl-ACP methyl ester carboxylesterase